MKVWASGLLLAACSHADPLREILEHPERAHGRIIQAEVYPFDTNSNVEKGTFLLCFDTCPQPWRVEPASVLLTRDGARFRGMNGTQPVVLTLRFDASCFVDFCHPHYPFWFEEVEPNPAP